jgi:hypothetical protein
MQDIAERSCQKSEMLQGYGDVVIRAETLEEQLVTGSTPPRCSRS